jgi:hypothetical protein
MKLSYHAGTLVIELPSRNQILHSDSIITSAKTVIHIKLISLHDLLAVNLNAKTYSLIDIIDASAYDLHRILCKAFSAFLPDPVCIDAVKLAWNCCCTLSYHCKRNIKMVV